MKRSLSLTTQQSTRCIKYESRNLRWSSFCCMQQRPRQAEKAAIVCFLLNKNQHFGGVVLAVSKKNYKVFESLLEAVTVALRKHVVVRSAIETLFRIDGTPILKLDDFYDGDIIVCCGCYERFADVGYKVNKGYIKLLASVMRRRKKTAYKEAKKQKPCADSRHKLPDILHHFLKVSRPIWQRGSTVIFKGYNWLNDKKYVIKMIDKENMRMVSEYKYDEVEIMRTLQKHPNIIDLVLTVEHPTHIYIVLQRLDSDLFAMVKGHFPLTESSVQKIMRDVAKGLQHIHSKQIIHRDMKPENLLVQFKFDESSETLYVNVVKIADFGLAISYKGQPLYQWCGTVVFMSPELVSFSGYDYIMDCWSLGVTLYVILTLDIPFGRSLKLHRIQDSIMKKKHQLPLTLEKTISIDLKNLLDSLLTKDPRERLSVSKLLEHPFLQLKL